MFAKVTIIGRLGRNPETKTSKAGKLFCSFNVAVDTGFGESKHTDWYGITAFGKQAETCQNYLKKGSLVCVTGSLQLREFDGRDGQRKSMLDVSADNVVFLSKQDEEQTNQTTQQPAPQSKVETFGSDIIDDEQIPF